MSINPDELINVEGFGGRTPFERPVPGQSLTNDPDTKYPWEQPPKFTNVSSATMEIVADSYEKETYEMIALTLADGMPVGSLASLILQAGFQEGKWNPDVMTLMMEPTMYMIIAFAEKTGIQDYVTYEGEEDDPSDEEEQLSGIEQAIEIAKDKIVPKVKAGVFPKEIEERLEEFTPPEKPSLLEKSETNQSESLLGREE